MSERWFVVQKYRDDGAANAAVKKYEDLEAEELDLLENHEGYREMEMYDWYIDEFKSYQEAAEFRMSV